MSHITEHTAYKPYEVWNESSPPWRAFWHKNEHIYLKCVCKCLLSHSHILLHESQFVNMCKEVWYSHLTDQHTHRWSVKAVEQNPQVHNLSYKSLLCVGNTLKTCHFVFVDSPAATAEHMTKNIPTAILFREEGSRPLRLRMGSTTLSFRGINMRISTASNMVSQAGGKRKDCWKQKGKIMSLH